MNYVETHCHLDFPQFHRDMEKTILRSFQAGLIFLINVGTDIRSSETSVNLASRYHEVYASVGVHPHEARKNLTSLNNKLIPLIKHPKAVAVGEIGLDYYRNLSTQEDQKEVFSQQLKLAKQYRKPVILHCRDAYRDLLNILDQEYLRDLGDMLPGVVHSFSAGPSYLQEFLRRGFYIGFNNMITYPDNMSLIESVKKTPLDRILLETDSPYLPPQALRGQRNEPQHVVDVAQMIAEIKQIDIEEVATITTANAIRLFGLK